jgi:hypothetical protein
MDDNINWFILLLLNFNWSRSSNVETPSGGVVERERGGVSRLRLVPGECHNTERERERERENTNAGCCGGVIKQLSEKDNVL